MKKSSGVLMHISSLPTSYGMGTMGAEAKKFVDFLVKSGIKYWQVLPLVQTGVSNSPYASCCSFSGNPYFIDFELLESDGLLNQEDYKDLEYGTNREYVDYGKTYVSRFQVLRIAYDRFLNKGLLNNEDFKKFEKENEYWLEDYSLFLAAQKEFNYLPWNKWEDKIKFRDTKAIEDLKHKLINEVNFWKFIQFEFDKQWTEIRKYANSNGIKIIGDIAFYVEQESSDFWAHPENYDVDNTLQLTNVGGCPPDGFSVTGQKWGTPVYNWESMEKNNYSWWIKRFEHSLKLYDVLRIDHFIGFENYYCIPYEAENAINGVWKKGPAMKLFNEVKRQFGEVNIIAEDLGIVTDDIKKFIKNSGFPGMKILQFAFCSDDKNPYLPKNIEENSVCYTGTHDNMTIKGWLEEGNKEEIRKCKEQFDIKNDDEFVWKVINGAYSTKSDLVIIPMQDFVNANNYCRMNTPGTNFGNWEWRIREECLNDYLARIIKENISKYNR